jgi:hypothetical protein
VCARFAKDGSSLTPAEFAAAVTAMLDRRVDPVERDGLFAEVDTDGDGRITPQELFRALIGGDPASSTLRQLRELLTPRRIGSLALALAARDDSPLDYDPLFADEAVDLTTLGSAPTTTVGRCNGRTSSR